MHLRRPGRHLLPRLPLVALLLSGAVSSLAGQQAAVPSPVPSVKEIESRIETLEATKNIEDAVKAKALELYRQALVHAKDHESQVSTLAAYKQLATSAPREVQQIRDDLQKPAAKADVASHRNEEIARLEARLTQAKTELGALKATIERHAAAISAQDTRPQKIREELARARERLKNVETELGIPPDANEHELVRAARGDLLQLRKAARSAEIEALEQEAVVYETRLALLKAQRDRDERAALDRESYVRALEELVSTRRQAEAQRVQSEAEQARQKAESNPALLPLAEENERLGADLARVTEQVESAERTRRDVESELNAIQEAFASARDKLEKVGLSGVLGEIFLEQRRKLPDLNRYRKKSAERRAEIGRIRVAQINVEESRRALADLDHAVQDVVESAGGVGVPPRRLQASVAKLLRDRVDLLQRLDTAYVKYVIALGDLDYQETQLAERYSDYAEYLDEHLLWTPSTGLLDLSSLRQIPPAVAWFVAPDNWRSVLEAGRSGIAERPVLSILFGLVVLGLLLSRRWCYRRLSGIGDRVGKKHADSFGLTVLALVLTVVIAAPIPLAMACSGWSLTSTIYAIPFARAVGRALLAASAVLMVLTTYSTFCWREGVAALHFRWSEPSRTVAGKNLMWLMSLGIPLLFVANVAEWGGNETYQNSLGRTAFVAGLVLVSVFAARVLSPRKGVLTKELAGQRDTWLYRLRTLWYGAVVVTPLVIAGVAVFGYYYTARQLDDRFFVSVLIFVGGVLVYQLIVRWLLIARKRLALARAREKREAEIAARGDVDEPEVMVDLDIPEIDLATVKKQTHGIFRTAVLIGVVISVVTVWADVLPALGVLDRELWTVRETTGGEDAVRSITISSVILSLAIALFSLVSARNLPGLLEVSVVRKLPIDPGSRYAVSTIGQYLFLAAGVILAFHTLGVAWGHVQWLVAALSVGLGFGLQEIFANFVSGLIILLERPVRVGDTVTIGEISGTVTRIRIRATTITDWDQKELVVPNKSFITGQLVNWSLSNPTTRLILKVGIAYGSDTELALRLMLQATKENAKVLEDPEPAVFFVGFGDSALDFEVRVFVKELSNRARTRIVHDLHMAIDQLFREHGVVIAFPQRDLHIKSDERDRQGSEPYSPRYDTGLD